jgi:hypothetical protein
MRLFLRLSTLLSAAALLAMPLAGQSIVNSEAGPSTLITQAPINLVDASGKSTKIDPLKIQPRSGTKLFSYTWKYVLTGSEAETTVAAPVKILLGKVNVREVTSGYHLVKVRKEGNTRMWSMKQGSDGFYPDSDAQVYKPKDAPSPKKGEDGAYTITLPKALPAGSYLLQTASEGWEFEVK